MTKEAKRIAELEALLCKLWGVMLAADLAIDNPYIKAGFAKVDAECRAAGLMAREGVTFIE